MADISRKTEYEGILYNCDEINQLSFYKRTILFKGIKLTNIQVVTYKNTIFSLTKDSNYKLC